MSATEVLVIGAGPFGLSISAHLRSRGVQHLIVGRPLDTWRAHMPAGMCLRSEPYGSDMASPRRGFDVGAYCESHGLDYVARLGPLSIERFLDYGDWFARQLVPDVLDHTVTEVTPVLGGFRVAFDEAESLLARQVVVATGVRPYAHLPRELRGFPSDLVTHTIDHHELDHFRGRSVAVVGQGQSAIETAALLHEQGAEVRMIARNAAFNWLVPNPERLGPLARIRRPANKLCEGWHCAFWNTPGGVLVAQGPRGRQDRSVLQSPRAERHAAWKRPAVVPRRSLPRCPRRRPCNSRDWLPHGPDQATVPARRPAGEDRHGQRLPGRKPDRGVDRLRPVFRGSALGIQPGPFHAVHRRNAQRRGEAREVPGPPFTSRRRTSCGQQRAPGSGQRDGVRNRAGTRPGRRRAAPAVPAARTKPGHTGRTPVKPTTTYRTGSNFGLVGGDIA
jgi:hypothetical protein